MNGSFASDSAAQPAPPTHGSFVSPCATERPVSVRRGGPWRTGKSNFRETPIDSNPAYRAWERENPDQTRTRAQPLKRDTWTAAVPLTRPGYQ
ncbi:hypothetical protein LshimejAT787_0306030 [Lyophyllum shimeji]|uniref:Uncharacterized protein n=1 Tax=Lyophyllum shimeji TaxID=47721 RepID=A0A9P3PHQ2_LYOSH|nr:hypothetical protein LshimejAT787_0306030 [Lyophyllum shimeji]